MRDQSSNDLSRALLAFAKDYGGDFGGAVPEDLIGQCERQLGGRLPEAYREFIRFHGWYDGPYLSVNGVPTDGLRGLDLVAETTWERTESANSLPTDLVPFGNDGAGNLFCVVVLGENAGEVVFVEAHRRDADAREVVASSMTEFVTSLALTLGEQRAEGEEHG